MNTLRPTLSSLLILGFVFIDVFAESRPHIILLLADDLGWQDVSHHGSEIATPNIDGLAIRGVQLNQFYVQPVCSPTRGALMTGRYPIRFGLQCGVVRPWANHGLPVEEQTLAQGLAAAGYETAVIGKWHLGHSATEYLPLQRGFTRQYGHYNGALDYFTHIRDGGHDWHRDDRAIYEQGYTTDLIGQEAVRLIQEHDKDKPLFLYVPFNAPHSPYQATERHLAKNQHIMEGRRRTYAAMVTNMDEAVGHIVSAADSHLPRENTLIFFCSDNGGITAVGSNGELRSQKAYLYEGGVRVPAIVAWDGALKAGSEVNEPLHIVDLYPTLLGLAGGRPKQKHPLDGKDAWPTIAKGAPTPHDFILLNQTPFHGAVRIGDWKIVHNGAVSANATEPPGQETWELFNLKNDPYEKEDLAAKRPKIFKRLQKKLTALGNEAVPPNIPPNKAPQGWKAPRIWGEN